MNIKYLIIILAIPLVFLTSYVNDSYGVGSGGFKNEVVDAEAMGKASSFVAQADNPSAIYYNPAGLTQLKGSYVSLGYTAEFPVNEVVSSTGDGTVQMQRQYFLVPNFYYVSDIGKENLRIGFGLTAPFGLGTDWAHDSYLAENATESDLTFSNLNPTMAYKLNDKFSIGAGLNFYNSEIEKHKRLDASLSTDGEFILKGTDSDMGYNVGFLFKPVEGHSIGLSYRSEVDVVYRGEAILTNINAGAYPALFGGSTYVTDIQSRLTLPQDIIIGYAYRPNDKWIIEADLDWTGWSSVSQDKVDYTSESDATRLAVLNDGNPASKDWNDVYSFGLGAEYKATERLALRGGYLYEQTPIPSANFDAALPDADRHGFSLGFGYKFKDNVKIDVSYLFLLFSDRKVTNDVQSNTGASVDGEYKAYVNLFAIGFTYKF